MLMVLLEPSCITFDASRDCEAGGALAQVAPSNRTRSATRLHFDRSNTRCLSSCTRSKATRKTIGGLNELAPQGPSSLVDRSISLPGPGRFSLRPRNCRREWAVTAVLRCRILLCENVLACVFAVYLAARQSAPAPMLHHTPARQGSLKGSKTSAVDDTGRRL